MCGIFAIFNSTSRSSSQLRELALKHCRRLRHRGPDWSGVRVMGTCAIAHERLAIVDPESGEQPLVSTNTNIVLAVNGEIYNYRSLQEKLQQGQQQPPYKYKTHSDCEVLIPMYMQHKEDMVQHLRGMWSFVLHDARTNKWMAARDHVGITPLYIGWATDGAVCFASEMKALQDLCICVQQFPPGHVYTNTSNQLERWYSPLWMQPDHTPVGDLDLSALRTALERSVRARMMSDVPWGVLLSGGLDSSLVASIASRYAAEESTSFPRLHSFCVGLVDSPDIQAASDVASYLGTVHHTYTYTLQDGIDALSDVIYYLETYDVTTIRAATPMFLMARKIKATGVKMVLSGEGADEIFGGYLYFHKAPSPEALHTECVEKVRSLHMYDCLRANKATSAWGVEARVPFLDSDFLNVVFALDPRHKMCSTERAGRAGRMEKWMLRKAFDTNDRPYLPSSVLWRQKEQMSDGVGYGWIDGLREYAAENVSDVQFYARTHRYPHNTPAHKEAYMYRQLFETHFPSEEESRTVPGGPSIACSTPTAVSWDIAFQRMVDQSGRAVGVHAAHYDDSVREHLGDFTGGDFGDPSSPLCTLDTV